MLCTLPRYIAVRIWVLPRCAAKKRPATVMWPVLSAAIGEEEKEVDIVGSAADVGGIYDK